MTTRLKNSQKGFTIIEVMIVLAIAGLILLIVFLAIPALQRNSRNTQRKNDIAALLAAVDEYRNNNAGRWPTACSNAGSIITFGVAPNITSQAKVGYYNQGCSTVNGNIQAGVFLSSGYWMSGPYSNAGQDFVRLIPSATCSTVTPGQSAPGSAKEIAVTSQIETGAGQYKGTCQES